MKLEELFRIHASIILMKSVEELVGNAPSITGITVGICLNPSQAEQAEIRWEAEITTAQLLPFSTTACVYYKFRSFSHREHIVALHVSGVLVFTFVVKLPEEVKGQNSVEVDNNSQQPHGQDQLKQKRENPSGYQHT